jgi:hypothetical protein
MRISLVYIDRCCLVSLDSNGLDRRTFVQHVEPTRFLTARSYHTRTARDRALIIGATATVGRQATFDVLAEIEHFRSKVMKRSAEFQRYASRLAALGAEKITP